MFVGRSLAPAWIRTLEKYRCDTSLTSVEIKVVESQILFPEVLVPVEITVFKLLTVTSVAIAVVITVATTVVITVVITVVTTVVITVVTTVVTTLVTTTTVDITTAAIIITTVIMAGKNFNMTITKELQQYKMIS